MAEREAKDASKSVVEIFSEIDLQTMPELFNAISEFCGQTKRPVVLMIDEVDSSSNNQVFLDFLSQLRGYYINRDEYPIFQSVILVGVYDVKSIKRKLRPEDEHRENSPWNIAADFDIDFAFSIHDIEKMLSVYKQDVGSKMDTKAVAEEIFAYSDGYPYLVSRICQKIDENLEARTWNPEAVRAAVNLILKEQNSLFSDMAKKLKDYPALKEMLGGILFAGKVYPFNINAELVSIGAMFGFLKEKDGQVVVANRIFEVWFYNLFISEEAIDSKTYDAGLMEKTKMNQANKLDMERILARFVEHFSEVYTDKDEAFVEEYGRKLFLLYIRPMINGVGNYYIEARTRSMGRTDLIIDYLGERYVIEMKIWRGEEYSKRGEEQLQQYLEDYELKQGYLLSFCFNKNKKVGVTKQYFRDAVIIEAVV